MKQTKHILVTIAILLCSLVTSAQTKVEIDGIWYNLVSKAKQAEVTYKGSSYNEYSNEYSGSIAIPTTVIYEGVSYSVTSIGSSAFEGCSSLTSITIPESVTSIGNYAFQYCSLTSITLPEGVTSIGYNAFWGCESLTSITIPEGVTSIRNNAFYECSSLTSITIPEGVTSIGEWAFSYCSSLTTITIPESVTGIGQLAFCRCSSLTSINIPENSKLTSIGEKAFSYCSSLTSIVLPKKLKGVGPKAFANCAELLDVYCYAESVPSASSDAFDGSYPEYITLHVPASALDTYKNTAPLNGFGTIVPLTDEEMGIDKSEIKNQDSGIIYDLHGRRVENPGKGIYIIGGKKVAIK